MLPLHLEFLLLLLLPHAVKVLILVTDSLKGVKEGGIGRRHISKGEPVQPLQVNLNLTTNPISCCGHLSNQCRCCSCNNFPHFFWNFGPSLLILSCMGLFGLLNFVMSLYYKFGLFEVKLRSIAFMFFGTALCRPMLWLLEFWVWFENDVLLVWLISFIALWSLFMFKSEF